MLLELPRVIEIEPTLSCNLRCRMCHVSFMPDEPRSVFDPSLIDRLSALRGVHVIIGSGFEPMMNRNFAEIVRKLTALDVQLELITNGTLLTDENVSALYEADVRIYNFSFDGIRRETYEHIRRRANFESTIEAILGTRRRFKDRDTLFCINSTMMKRNIDEIPEIVDFWDSADFDLLRFLTMVIRENEPNLIRESLYPVRNTYYALLEKAADDIIARHRKIVLHVPRRIRAGGYVMSDNPKSRTVPRPRQTHQLGSWPGMSVPCKSPWTFARILPDGDVQLCYKFTVGNLREETFEQIWVGEKAEQVRAKVIAEREHCVKCDYFRFCLQSDNVDTEEVQSYFSEPLMAGLATVNFETGEMTLERQEPPILIESISGYNIVRFRGEYMTVPQSIGPVDIENTEIAHLPGVSIVKSLSEARRKIG